MNPKTGRERFRADLQRHLALLLGREVHDPRLQGVSITRIELGRGNEAVHVWVHSMLADDGGAVTAGLQRLAGYFRHALGRSLRRRRIPELRFHWDRAFEEGERMIGLLDRMGGADDHG